jgi:hypothetical protein
MGRSIAAVVVAEVVWTAFWLGGSYAAAAALPDLIVMGEPMTHMGVLLGYIAYSVVISVGAGYLAAWVKGENPMATVWAFACLQLVLGIGFEVTGWDLAPAWYHIVFLVLLIPATVFGGKMRSGAAAST